MHRNVMKKVDNFCMRITRWILPRLLGNIGATLKIKNALRFTPSSLTRHNEDAVGVGVRGEAFLPKAVTHWLCHPWRVPVYRRLVWGDAKNDLDVKRVFRRFKNYEC